ncbi:MAG TPA: PQQ-binding-like beta-propeller repeat protein [Stellaceae bacterium]|nr:PQQ-binding-like beta-propeller repeat protein [Stellaceae bacterium]
MLVAALLALAGCDTIGNLTDSLFAQSKDPLPGKRIPVLGLNHQLEADPNLAAVQVRLPPPYDNPAWPDAGGYPSHAMYHLALGDKIGPAWHADIGDGASRYGRITAQPVVEDGRVFVMDANDTVSAYDAKDGHRLWRFDTQPKDMKDQAYGGGVAIAGDRLYVGTGYGQVLALEAATGKEIWRHNMMAPVHGSPTAAEGRVFAVTVDNQLEVVSAADGHVLWTHTGIPEPADLLGAPSPAVEGDIVVAPYSSGEIFALRVENGRVLWSDSLATPHPLGALSSLADIRGAPVIDRDRVFAVSHSGLMVAIDLRTGDRVWEQDIGGTHTPWVAGDFVYVIANDQELLCLGRQDGKIRWARDLPRYEDEKKKKDPLFWTGPVLAGDRLIVISSQGEAFSVSPYTGAPLGRTEFPDSVFVTPAVAGATLYVLTSEAVLIALR